MSWGTFYRTKGRTDGGVPRGPHGPKKFSLKACIFPSYFLASNLVFLFMMLAAPGCGTSLVTFRQSKPLQVGAQSYFRDQLKHSNGLVPGHISDPLLRSLFYQWHWFKGRDSQWGHCNRPRRVAICVQTPHERFWQVPFLW